MCFSKLLWFNNNLFSISTGGSRTYNDDAEYLGNRSGTYQNALMYKRTINVDYIGACLWFNTSGVYILSGTNKYKRYSGIFQCRPVSVKSPGWDHGACLWFNNKETEYSRSGGSAQSKLSAGSYKFWNIYRYNHVWVFSGACRWFNNNLLVYILGFGINSMVAQSGPCIMYGMNTCTAYWYHAGACLTYKIIYYFIGYNYI